MPREQGFRQTRCDKRKGRRMRESAFVVLLCSLAAMPALATPSYYGSAGVQYVGPIRGMDLELASSASYGLIHTFEDVGLQRLQFTDVTLGGPGSVPIPANSYFNLGYTEAFCIDLWDGYPVGPEAPYPYQVLSLDGAPDPYSVPALGGMGTVKAELIAELLAHNSYDTPQEAAAIQAAIFEIVDENHNGGSNPWNVSGGQGNFYLDTVNGTHGEDIIAGLANNMLAFLTTGLSFDPYTAVSNGPGIKNVQDFVMVGPTIPAPGAFLLTALGVGLMSLMRRKFT
jgi:hypothetical protein